MRIILPCPMHCSLNLNESRKQSNNQIKKLFSINILFFWLNSIWVYWSFGNKTIFYLIKKKSFSISLEWMKWKWKALYGDIVPKMLCELFISSDPKEKYNTVLLMCNGSAPQRQLSFPSLSLSLSLWGVRSSPLEFSSSQPWSLTSYRDRLKSTWNGFRNPFYFHNVTCF